MRKTLYFLVGFAGGVADLAGNLPVRDRIMRAVPHNASTLNGFDALFDIRARYYSHGRWLLITLVLLATLIALAVR